MFSKLVRHRDAVVAYLLSSSGDKLLYIGRSVPYQSVRSPANCERMELDASGHLLRPLSATSCEVIMLIQLREIRNRVPAAVFKVVQRKRLANLVRLKEYAEGLPTTGSVTPPHARVVASRISQSASMRMGMARAKSPRGSPAASAGTDTADTPTEQPN